MTPQQLKNAILQQAIQGKLVEQRAEEGTGQDLFEAIQDEKQQLIKEGKLKKQKALPDITADEIPFEIPDTWKWVRLGEISTYSQTKKKINVAEIETPMWSLDLKDIEKESGKIIRRVMTNDRKISGEKNIFKKGQILYSKLRPYLKKILIAPGNGVCSSELVPFDMIGNCDNRFIVYVLKSAYVDFLINSVTYGVKMPRVGTDTMINLLIPLPPLDEQKRIVEKIEELLPLVERYEKAWTRLEELNKKFPLDMQKAILGQAIQGKLVEQRAEEGTGQELYKAIQDEKKNLIEEGKLKKQKALPDITADEIPFEIPDTWKWVRLGEISTYSQTKKKINVAEIETPMWSLDLKDIEKESGKIIRRVMTNDRKISGEKNIFKKGQILYSKLRPYLKKILIAPGNGVCSSELVPFDMIGNCDNRFIVYVLKSAYVDFLINSVTYGVKMPRVGTDTMINLLIPLPPLDEQKRIVEKIEELLPLVEKLK